RTLEKKHYAYSGLNLNIRTLMSITKYFYNKKQNNKQFLYDSDYEFLKSELKEKEVYITKSIDAEIMDVADEIAYAAHDLEDALSFGMISLGEIVYEFSISDEYKEAHPTIARIAKETQAVAMQAKSCGTSEE